MSLRGDADAHHAYPLPVDRTGFDQADGAVSKACWTSVTWQLKQASKTWQGARRTYGLRAAMGMRYAW